MKKISTTHIGSFPKLISLFILPKILFAQSLLSLGVGTFDTLRPKERMLQFQLEYQFAASFHGLQPFTNLMFSEQGSTYICFGGLYDIPLGPNFFLTPSFAPGIYIKGGGKQLGFPLEFRSSIAFSGQFRNRNRLGLQFYHISNGSLGFKNPGEESLVLFYSFAL